MSPTLSACILTALAVVAATGVAPAAQARSASVGTGLPLLSPGRHLGQKSFSPADPPVLDVLQTRVDEAAAAGMDVGRIHLDWAELEPRLGQYDFDPFDEQLEALQRNALQPMLTLGFTDVEAYSLPADLMDPDAPDQLASGVHLDNPDVIGRYTALLQELAPRLEAAGVWLLSVANEPNALLNNLDDATQSEAAADMAEFVEQVRLFAHDELPGIAVSVSLADGGVEVPAHVRPIIAATDVAAFNFGCLDLATFALADPATISGSVDTMLAAAEGRKIVIQELSCASGYEDQPSPLNATLASQARWFEEFYAVMANQPLVRAAFVLDPLDWPQELADTSSQVIEDEGFPELAAVYGEFLATWGLLRATDGSAKPSWTAFVDAISAQAAEAGR